jgi:hypothetical protein
MPNIHNVISDVQEKVTANHFPITASVWGVEGEWTVVQFKCANNPDRNFLNVEVHIENQVSCVLEQVGFTNDQRYTIMEIFVSTMFP